ncbi:MAG TPA: uroporphyrinogen-III synthase [Sphingomicrobium sp.]|nr:uroporphyrinogen-III synthase [Sphingomicrobium sp.]
MRPLLLLRPEPGLSASAGRGREMGLEIICCPLFKVEPTAWELPDPSAYDALLLTSANAVRHGGPGLGLLTALPVHAVGEATAEAARQAGFRVESIGTGESAALLASLPASLRLLHLAGEHHQPAKTSPHAETRIVYRSAEIADPGLPDPAGLVAAVHSPRAGRRLAELVTGRGRTAIAAISTAAAAACGIGWERVEAADQPSDSHLLALAGRLCHTPVPR